jgi:ankyrin repeat protein
MEAGMKKLLLLLVLSSPYTLPMVQQNPGVLYGELIAAIQVNDKERLKKAIKNGAATINTAQFFYNPLTLAALSQEPKTIRLLVDAGADIDALNNTGHTPLNHIITLIVNDPNNPNSTKLYAALDLLLNAGATITQADLDVARQAGIEELTELLENRVEEQQQLIHKTQRG